MHSLKSKVCKKKVIFFLHQAFCTTMHWTPVTTCIGLSIAPEEKHVSSSNLHLLGTLLFLITRFSALYNINNRTVLNSLSNAQCLRLYLTQKRSSLRDTLRSLKVIDWIFEPAVLSETWLRWSSDVTEKLIYCLALRNNNINYNLELRPLA